MRKLRAAIIGLGKIGIDFDLKESRSKKDDIWTHYLAYKSLNDKYDLVAAVEIDENKIKEVNKFDPNLKILKQIELLTNEKIDVISICTPETSHFKDMQACKKICKGMFVEKPLFSSETDIDLLSFQKSIHDENKPLYINYYKRQEPSVLKLMTYLKSEKMTSFICKYSGFLDAVGSHAIDLINFIMPIKNIGFIQHNLIGTSAIFLCENKFPVYLNHTGDKKNLIFEIEIVTENYRFLLEDNLATLKIQKFKTSSRYKDYFELQLEHEFHYTSNPHRLVGYLDMLYQDIIQNKADFTNFNQSIESQNWLSKLKSFTN